MLKKFDLFCEDVLTEGRKSDDKKKFKFKPDVASEHINSIGEKHHLFVHDKGHFGDIIEGLSSDEVYTPKSFTEHVKEIMKGKGKAQIADGYAKLLYAFLNDRRTNSPFEEYSHSEENESEQPEHGEVSFDEVEPVENELENSY
jgi:hypothetical protein